jgi:hypothetical protein
MATRFRFHPIPLVNHNNYALGAFIEDAGTERPCKNQLLAMTLPSVLLVSLITCSSARHVRDSLAP